MNRFFRSALFPLIVIVLLVYLASQTLIPHSKGAQKTTLADVYQRVQANPSSIKTAVFSRTPSAWGLREVVSVDLTRLLPREYTRFQERFQRADRESRRRYLGRAGTRYYMTAVPPCFSISSKSVCEHLTSAMIVAPGRSAKTARENNTISSSPQMMRPVSSTAPIRSASPS